MKRAVIIVVILVALLALAGPFLPLGFLKQSIAGTLAKALGRRVEIDDVSLTLFPQPALDRKSTRLNSSHIPLSRMPSSA